MSKRLNALLIIGLFLGSFIIWPGVLNENNEYKKFWVELFITGLSFIKILELLVRNSFKFSINSIDILIVLLVVNHFIVAVFMNSNLVFGSVVYIFVFFYFVLKLVLSNAIRSEIETYKRTFVTIVPIVAIFHITIAFVQHFCQVGFQGSELAIGSTFGNPDMLGSYLVILLPFCFMDHSNNHIIGYAILFLTLATLVILQARSAILAIICCGLTWLIINVRLKKTIIIILAAFSLTILSILIFWHPESVIGRLFVWFIAAKMICQKPWGWGLNAFEKHYPEFQATYISANERLPQFISPEVVHSPFNEFLNVGVTIGVSGLLLFTLLLVKILSRSFKTRSLIIYPLITFLVISLLYFPFRIYPLVCLLVPLVAVISSRHTTRESVYFSKGSVRVIYIGFILMSTIFAIGSINGLLRYNKWRFAHSISKEKEFITVSQNIFYDLYPVLRKDAHFLITYADQKCFAGDYDAALLLLEEAQKYYCDITLSIKLATLYEKQGCYDLARQKYELAVNLAPKQVTAAYERILFLIRIGDHNGALNASIDLLGKPDEISSYGDTYIIKSRLKKIVHDYEFQRHK